MAAVEQRKKQALERLLFNLEPGLAWPSSWRLQNWGPPKMASLAVVFFRSGGAACLCHRLQGRFPGVDVRL